MKFQIAALAFAAAGAMAHGHKNDTMMTSTVWQTVERTVLSCAPTVTNCPAESRSAVVVTDTVALYTTICPVTAAEASSTKAAPAPVKTNPAPAPPAPVTTAAPVATNTPMAPGAGQTYATEPCPTAGAASSTLGTVTAPAATGSSAPIQTGAAVRAGPAMGGLAVAAAVAMML